MDANLTRRQVDDIGKRIVAVLRDADRKPEYRGHKNPYFGHCYLATQVLWNLIGGKKSGATPMNLKHEGNQHWFLKLKDGSIVDLTAKQFSTPVPYGEARGRGFQTGFKPDKRAVEVLRRLANQPSTTERTKPGGGGAAIEFGGDDNAKYWDPSESIFREPLWHGSDRVLTKLVPSAPTTRRGGHGEYGIYLTTRQRYARGYGQNIYSVMALVRRPLIVEGKYEVSPGDLTREDIQALKRRGYDAVVVVGKGKRPQDADEVVLFDESQARIIGRT